MIAHWVHHRGNIEVHLRRKDGPSHEDSPWKKQKPNVWYSHATPARGPGQTTWQTGPQQQDRKSCISVSNWLHCSTSPQSWIQGVLHHGGNICHIWDGHSSAPCRHCNSYPDFRKTPLLCVRISSRIPVLIKPLCSLHKLPSSGHAPMA